MRQTFLPSGRVRYVPCSEYVEADSEWHAFTSRLSGQRREVRVRRKLVDTRYLEGQIPAATASLPFEVDEGVRWCTAGDATRLAHAARRFAVVGAGKTATDTCVWLLEQGIAPDAICWIKLDSTAKATTLGTLPSGVASGRCSRLTRWSGRLAGRAACDPRCPQN